ncbi:MAG: type I-U CRISPR-associated protein Csb2 [Caldilineaceae bacterium]|nr:type I-U CRISPR-associated protein Csb2 [Caldilineaceae bacterium]
MFSVSVELLHGVFRGDADGTANTGHQAQGEWPPSPARLFAAFVAADGTGTACRVTDGSELEWLEGLQPPSIYADPQPTHTPLLPRYVVEHRNSSIRNQHQEYPARKGTRVWPGVRVCPRTPMIYYTWDTPLPSPNIFAALQRRAARIGYLGTADSPARVQVLSADCLPTLECQNFAPHPDGQTWVNVPQPGDLAIWDRMHEQWIERGPSLSRTQFHALKHKARYCNPTTEVQPSLGRGQVVVWLRVEPAVSGRRVSDMTELFKKALLVKYQFAYGEPPPVLHGHGINGKGHDALARYLALPDVGYQWSNGLIHGLALWMPSGASSLDRRRARDAAFSIRKLTGRGINVSVVCQDSEAHPWAIHPDRWGRKSRIWATAVPAIHEQWRRQGISLADLAVWCAHAGLPEPVDFRSTRTPLVSGGIDLAPSEVHRPGRPARPYSHMEIRFEEPIPGPVVIGAGRQRGFGLCIPMDESMHTSTSSQ